MRIRQQAPKLGALCRWVRDLDVISGLAEQRDGHAARTAAQAETLRVLDAILRVTGPVDHHSAPGPDGEPSPSSPSSSRAEADNPTGPMAVRPAWDLRDAGRPRRMVYDSVADGTLAASTPAGVRAQFRVIQTIPGAERNPPNRHAATLYASRDGAIALAPAGSPAAPPTALHTHPAVPGLRLLRDVLSPDECGRVVGAAEAIGFAPDAPVRPGGDDGRENSVLAHNFYWVADEEFCSGIWGRVAPFVPERVGGRKVRGLNRRFRVYRYVPGAEYRAHIGMLLCIFFNSLVSSSIPPFFFDAVGIYPAATSPTPQLRKQTANLKPPFTDGAWPPSGILPDDTYQYDASPAGAKQSSLFTFLIYLNDEFEAGETTFFLPAAREGTLNAYPVRPIQGSVAMFPHGEAEGSLLHEGTGVRRGERPSAKYVIRTDVEYDVEPGRE